MAINKPFGLISDTHNHEWSAFSTVLPTGVNSRLQSILDETIRCADEVLKAGGDTLYHGGDLFHVRGSLSPTVLNPTVDTYRQIIESGVKIIINAGNHDLAAKESARISNAVTALETIGCHVVNNPGGQMINNVAVFPWIPQISALKTAIETTPEILRSDMDLLIHAPVDGFMIGLPDHGIDDKYLASLGFRRVFCGHYHNNHDFGNGVHSIGALTHQTWGDVGSKAGFLIVGDDVRYFASHAPSFIEIDSSVDPDDIPLMADGNYVKVTIDSSKVSDAEMMREFLMDRGAKGVLIKSQPRAATTARTGTTLKAGATLDQSVGDFISIQPYKRKPELNALCLDILNTARSI